VINQLVAVTPAIKADGGKVLTPSSLANIDLVSTDLKSIDLETFNQMTPQQMKLLAPEQVSPSKD
jgi:hypothetical protein